MGVYKDREITEKMMGSLLKSDKERFMIESTIEKDPETNTPLYWADSGWVNESNGNVFTRAEKNEFLFLPENGQWVVGEQTINELQEPNIVSPREVVDQLHVVVKSVRDLKWSIERDNIELNDDYISPLASAINNLEAALNTIEPISDKLEKYASNVK